MASLKYFLLRTVLFVVPFALFMVMKIGVIFSAVFAVIIAFALNFLFFSRQRNAAAGEVREVFSGRKEVRSKKERYDAEEEDAIDDAQRAEDEGYEGRFDTAQRPEEDGPDGSRTDRS